jgi:hypothetical protein
MFDINELAAMQVGLASPDTIRSWSMAKLPNPRPSTTVRKSRKWEVSSAKRSSVRPRTTNAIAASTRRSVIRASPAKSAVSRSSPKSGDGNGSAISNSFRPAATFGTSRASLRAWALCLMFPRSNSRKSSISPRISFSIRALRRVLKYKDFLDEKNRPCRVRGYDQRLQEHRFLRQRRRPPRR